MSVWRRSAPISPWKTAEGAYPRRCKLAGKKIYKKVEQRLETGWETTIALIQQGIHEGTVRPIQIPILKTMMEATLEQFFQRDILITNQISYNEALEEVVNILVDGITR